MVLSCVGCQLSLNRDGRIFVQVQKVNGWKASLGGVHLQKIENQVHNIILKQRKRGNCGFAIYKFKEGAFVLTLIVMMDQVQLLTRFNFPQCLEVLSRLEYPLLGQGVAGVKQ